MIQIELPTAIAVYSAVLGLLVAGIWIYTEIFVRRPQRYLGKQFLWRCTYCAFIYLDEGARQIPKCPQCASFNSVEERAVPAGLLRPANGAQHEHTKGPNTSRRKRHHPFLVFPLRVVALVLDLVSRVGLEGFAAVRRDNVVYFTDDVPGFKGGGFAGDKDCCFIAL